MSVQKNRASVLAVVEEVTAGTVVFPSTGTDYLALQEGFSFTPNFQTLENAEIRAGIGKSKPIQGLESPEGSFSHYARHSGVEGQAPNWKHLLKAAMGASTVNGTQRTTTTGSTVGVVNLGAGGSDFARGFAILVKNTLYEIRPIHSVSTNALTLGFNLLNAPGSGVGVGKCANFSVANTGHPTLSMTLYRGNGGAIEAIAGCRVSEMAISVAAGQLINASFNFQGTKYFFDPVEITSSNNKIDFTDDDGTVAATITVGVYRDPHEFAAAAQTAMQAANAGETPTVTYSDTTGKFTIKTTGTVLTLKWNTGTNTATSAAAKLGFSTAADSSGTGATTGYTSTNAFTLANAVTPSYDTADPNAAKNNEVLIGDATNTTCFCAATVDIRLVNTIVDAECVCAESGVQEKVISGREVTANIVGYLEPYDADKFKKFRNNDDVRFLFNFGPKSGGNWVVGKACSIYMPSAVVSAFALGDVNGLVSMNITVSAFMDTSGNGEFYVNFL